MNNLIIIPKIKLSKSDLEQFRNNPFENLIKFVVDIKKEILALGGEMHADAELELVNQHSMREDLWGANLWPWKEKVMIEYVSLINIRPSLNNFSMEIKDKIICKQVDKIVYKWLEI